MSAEVAVRPVRTSAEARAFCDLPYRLYAGDPFWVPPLRTTEAARWRAHSNASLLPRRHERFVAWRGGRAVGRVAVNEDGAFAERWTPGAGLFGFFECERDGGVARELLLRAEETLRSWDLTRALGPINLTTHDQVGLLVSGFQRSASILTPYNPLFYAGLVESAGYRGSREYLAYDWDTGSRCSKVVDRLVRREALPGQVRVRSVVPGDWNAEVRRLYGLYNACFDDVWGFVPIGWEEFVQRASEFRPFYRPEMVVLAEADGRPVGFAVLLPDVNEALPVARGRLLPWGWWRLRLALPRIRSGRLILMGVLPRFRGRGIAACLASHLGAAVRRAGFTRVEVSMVLDGNTRMQNVIAAYGCREARRYRLYERDLTS